MRVEESFMPWEASRQAQATTAIECLAQAKTVAGVFAPLCPPNPRRPAHALASWLAICL